jgi:hypothetical protein
MPRISCPTDTVTISIHVKNPDDAGAFVPVAVGPVTVTVDSGPSESSALATAPGRDSLSRLPDSDPSESESESK